MADAEISKKKDTEDEINKILESVRASLQNHGGDATLREVKDGIVYLDLHGACQGCPMAEMTFGIVVEEAIRECLPEIKDIVF